MGVLVAFWPSRTMAIGRFDALITASEMSVLLCRDGAHGKYLDGYRNAVLWFSIKMAKLEHTRPAVK